MARSKWTLVFVLLFSLLFIPAHFLNSNIESYDDRSYLAHAFTIGLDFDLDYGNEIAIRYNRDGTIPAHPIGTGLLAAPFVALFGIIDRVTAHPVLSDRSQYFKSWGFFGFLIAVNVYFLTGLFLYYRALVWINPEYGFGLNLIIVLSTGLTYYALGRFTLSHGFEFFALAGTLYASVRLYRSVQKLEKRWVIYWLAAIGFFTVLNLWIRPANINSLTVPFICLLTLSVLRCEKVSTRLYLGVVIAILFFLVPYWMFNVEYYHGIFPTFSEAYNAKLGRGFPGGILNGIFYAVTLAPNLGLIILSSEFGVLYTNPVIIIGFIGFLYFVVTKITNRTRLQLFSLLIMVLFYYAFSFAIVLVWKTTASDYGYRYLFPIIPISMLFTVIFLREVMVRHYTFGRLVKCVIITMCIVGLINVFFYKTTPSLSPKEQENVYGEWHSSSVKGYETNLVRELGNYRTYVLAIGKTYYGFLVASYVLDTDIVGILSEEQRDKYLDRFRDIALVIYLQTFVLLVLWGSFGWYFDRLLRKEV